MKQLVLQLKTLSNYLVDGNSENQNVIVATISHKEYKDVLLNKNVSRRLINRIQSKNHKIRTYDVKRIPLSCFDDKIYIQSNGYNGLALGY